MKLIGLTGGIGTGKSTVSQYLKTKGYEIIDADQIARQVVEPGAPALSRLAERFGAEILLADGSLNRRRLAQLAFASPEGKAALDSITHSAIFARIEEQRAKLEQCYADDPTALVFLDAPLLLETGLERMTDQVWMVDVPDQVRMERIRLRDGWTEEEIRARMKNQMGRREKLERADRVIDNSGTVKRLYDQVDCLLAEMGGAGQ